MPFMLSCEDRFVDIAESHVRNDRNVLLYPHGHGGPNQLWRLDANNCIVSMLNENVCLGVPTDCEEIKADIDVVIQHVADCKPMLCFEPFEETQNKDDLKLRLKDNENLQLGFDIERWVLKLIDISEKPLLWKLIPKNFEYCRPATSCTLFWLTEPSKLKECREWRLKCRVQVEESADCTYYCSIGFFPGGYAGIQRINDEHRVVIFSLWNTDDGLVEVVEKGEEVEVSPFDSEGTGQKSMKRVLWRDQQPITLFVDAKLVDENEDNLDDRQVWICTCHYVLHENDSPVLMASFKRRSLEPLLVENGFYSFIEDWNRVDNAEGCLERRSALFDQASMALDGHEEKMLKKCRMTKVEVGHDKFGCNRVRALAKSNGVFVATGGDVFDQDKEDNVCENRAVGRSGTIISCCT